MEHNSLLQRIAQMKQSLLDEGILNQRFVGLEEMKDEDIPNFVELLMELYYEDTTKRLAALSGAVEENPVHLCKLDKILHQLEGSTSSIGANQVSMQIHNARIVCGNGNLEEIKTSLQKIVTALDNLKAKLEPYFQLVRQASSAGAAN